MDAMRPAQCTRGCGRSTVTRLTTEVSPRETPVAVMTILPSLKRALTFPPVPPTSIRQYARREYRTTCARISSSVTRLTLRRGRIRRRHSKEQALKGRIQLRVYSEHLVVRSMSD